MSLENVSSLAVSANRLKGHYQANAIGRSQSSETAALESFKRLLGMFPEVREAKRGNLGGSEAEP